MSKRTKLTVDQVKTAYLAGGVARVEALTQDHKDPRKTLRNAVTQLNALYEVTSDAGQPIEAANPDALVSYCDDLDAQAAARKGAGRGRSPATVNTERAFKVQRNKATGALFMTIPLPEGTIEATHGDVVMARFNEGSIVLS